MALNPLANIRMRRVDLRQQIALIRSLVRWIHRHSRILIHG